MNLGRFQTERQAHLTTFLEKRQDARLDFNFDTVDRLLALTPDELTAEISSPRTSNVGSDGAHSMESLARDVNWHSTSHPILTPFAIRGSRLIRNPPDFFPVPPPIAVDIKTRLALTSCPIFTRTFR